MKNFLLSLFVAIPFFSFSQSKKTALSVDISISKEVKTKGGLRQQLLGMIGDKMITYGIKGAYVMGKPSKGKAIFNIWDNNLNLKKVIDQQNKFGEHDLRVDDFSRTHLINGQILQLATFDVKKATELYILKINPTTFKIENSLKVHELSDTRGNRDNFALRVSRNKEYFAFIIYNSKGASTEMIFKIFNSDIEEIVEIKKDFPYPEKEVFITNFNYYEDGNMFFKLKRNYRKKGELKLTQEKTFYKCDTKKGAFVSIDTDDTKYPILSSDYSYDDGVLSFSGFYEKDDKEHTSGVFTRTFNATSMSLIHEEYKGLEFKFITEDFSDREKKRAERKKKKGKDFNIYTYVVKEVTSYNGGFICMAERYRHYTTTHHGSNGSVTYTEHYIFNEIVLFNFSNSGEINWIKKIDKKQHTVNDGGRNGSFYYKIKGNTLYTVHAEREERRKRDLGVFLTKLDLNSGKTETKKVISELETDILFVPSSTYVELDENRTVFIGYKRKGLFPKYKKLTFATLDFK